MSNRIDLIKAGRLLVLKEIYAKHRATLARIEAKAQDVSQGIKVVRVHVNEENWGLYTVDAYQELRSRFSTGHFHTHTSAFEYVESFEGVITLDDLNEETGAL
jgi:hypothetical protein